MSNKLKLPKGTPALYMDSPTFADDLVKVIGHGPHQFTGPQFHRTDGLTISAPNLTSDEWQNLESLSIERIRNLGCQVWQEDVKGTHWLFPGEWYPHIPAGTLVVSISGDTEKFDPGVTGDDIRFGALAYGFITAPTETKKRKAVYEVTGLVDEYVEYENLPARTSLCADIAAELAADAFGEKT